MKLGGCRDWRRMVGAWVGSSEGSRDRAAEWKRR